MMLNSMLLISMVISLTVFNRSVLSLPGRISTSEGYDETVTEVAEAIEDPETDKLTGEQISSRHGGRTDFTLRDLFPTYFGEFFEIFVFFMELKWHYEIEDAIAEAGERIDDHHQHSSHGAGAHRHDDNFLLDFAKHYFVSNNTSLWKFKA